jgi:hypothetical protein
MLHEAGWGNLATLLAEACEVGRRLPWDVEWGFSNYLACEVLTHWVTQCT